MGAPGSAVPVSLGRGEDYPTLPVSWGGTKASEERREAVPRYRPDIDSIPRYVPGKPIDEVAREIGISDIVKLASNESPVPPFPEVVDAIADAAGDVNRYPEDSSFHLVNDLAERLGTTSEHIWMGAGSTQLLAATAHAMAGPGASVVYAWPSFVGYRIAAAMSGMRTIEVPLDDDARHDVGAMVAAIDDDTTLLYLCNPNNPTGTHVAASAVDRLVDAVPDRVLVVLDEAYHEYAAAPDYASGIRHAVERPNVLVTRTFSKVYGLAGLRVGFGVGSPDLLANLRRMQLPFVVNSVAQAAARAALQHDDRLEARVKDNATGRDHIEAALAARDVAHHPSQTNFVAIKPDMNPRVLAEAMLERGVIVRPLGSLVRVTVGTEAENDRFIAALDEVLGS